MSYGDNITDPYVLAGWLASLVNMRLISDYKAEVTYWRAVGSVTDETNETVVIHHGKKIR